jgi:hypothetical protein
MGWCVLGCALLGAHAKALALDPPFSGTVWVDKEIILPSEWTAYQLLNYSGVAERFVYDRRDNVYLMRQMHIFDATYADAPEIEVRVNSNDFSTSIAAQYAASYAEMLGRLPTALRADLMTMTIHGGGALPFGGSENGILIHVDVESSTVDFLEEILVHEATHAIYGATHDLAPAWQAAQAADPTFISTYAHDYPNREDVAESLLMWYAVRHRSDRLDAATIAAIEAAIPNRLAYFDALPFAFSASIPGDSNFDGHADAADYVMWRKNLYRTQSQYDLWRAHFGQTAGGSSGAAANATVPESATIVMLILAAAAGILLRQGRITDRIPSTRSWATSASNPTFVAPVNYGYREPSLPKKGRKFRIQKAPALSAPLPHAP